MTFIYDNTRLLLLSKSDKFPSGLANLSGQVGKHLMAHMMPNVYAMFDDRQVNNYMGPSAQKHTIDDFNADNFDQPAPIVSHEVEADRGPVLVTVEYRIDPKDREPFLAALAKLAYERRRDGAYAWGVFEDAAQEGRMLETFLVDSRLEHFGQHERVTNADRVVQAAVYRFQTEGTLRWPPAAEDGPAPGSRLAPR
jgi:hypothetical protein